MFLIGCITGLIIGLITGFFFGVTQGTNSDRRKCFGCGKWFLRIGGHKCPVRRYKDVLASAGEMDAHKKAAKLK